MPKYTLVYTTNANEEIALTAIVAAYNVSQKVSNPAFVDITNKDYLDMMLGLSIKDYKRQHKETLRKQAADAVIFD